MSWRGRCPARALIAQLAMAVWLSVPALLMAPPAEADLYGPDDSFSQAYGPLSQQVTYSGALRSPGDLDYFYFEITRPGEALHFTVRNTLGSCSSPGTFPQSGRYYLVLESSGDLPTYTLRLDPARSGSSGVPPGTPPALRSLRVLSPQRGSTVRARLVFGQPISRLQADLLRLPGGSRVGRVVRHRLGRGSYALAVRVNSAAARSTLRRVHRLRVALKVIVRAASGQTYSVTRGVTLRG